MQRIDVCAPNSDMKTDIIRGPLVIADIREGQGFGRGENQKLPPGLFLGCRVAFGTAAMSLEAGEGRTDRDAAIDTRAEDEIGDRLLLRSHTGTQQASGIGGAVRACGLA